MSSNFDGKDRTHRLVGIHKYSSPVRLRHHPAKGKPKPDLRDVSFFQRNNFELAKDTVTVLFWNTRSFIQNLDADMG